MKRENKQSELEVYLEMMQTNVKRQEDFIAQIVNYAKNNKLEILPEEINLKTMLLEIFQNHEFIEGASSIQKYVQVSNEMKFISDRNRMMIILNNLVSNAIRYSDKQKAENRFIDIRIDITPTIAIIDFSDNGIGIEEAYLDKIFNMFYRANFNSKGSGLGLFILKEAITKLRGDVTVESKINEGTRFIIKIPNLYQTTSLKFPNGYFDESNSKIQMKSSVSQIIPSTLN
jgi:signal transduction histidine kinase